MPPVGPGSRVAAAPVGGRGPARRAIRPTAARNDRGRSGEIGTAPHPAAADRVPGPRRAGPPKAGPTAEYTGTAVTPPGAVTSPTSLPCRTPARPVRPAGLLLRVQSLLQQAGAASGVSEAATVSSRLRIRWPGPVAGLPPPRFHLRGRRRRRRRPQQGAWPPARAWCSSRSRIQGDRLGLFCPAFACGPARVHTCANSDRAQRRTLMKDVPGTDARVIRKPHGSTC